MSALSPQQFHLPGLEPIPPPPPSDEEAARTKAIGDAVAKKCDKAFRDYRWKHSGTGLDVGD